MKPQAEVNLLWAWQDARDALLVLRTKITLAVPAQHGRQGKIERINSFIGTMDDLFLYPDVPTREGRNP